MGKQPSYDPVMDYPQFLLITNKIANHLLYGSVRFLLSAFRFPPIFPACLTTVHSNFDPMEEKQHFSEQALVMAPMAPPNSFIPMQVAGVFIWGRKVPEIPCLWETLEGNNARKTLRGCDSDAFDTNHVWGSAESEMAMDNHA